MLLRTEEFPVKTVSGYKKNKIVAYSCWWVGGAVFADGPDLVPVDGCLFAELLIAERGKIPTVWRSKKVNFSERFGVL